MDELKYTCDQLLSIDCDIFHASSDEISLALSQLRHSPPSVPRRVIFPRITLPCPHELKRELRKIKKELRDGNDITWRLSKKKDRLNDALLNHWNIHHLHITSKNEPRWTRNDLLFCVIKYNRVYMLGVWDHHIFDDTRPLFEFIDDVFPKLFPIRADGLQMEIEVKDEDYRPLREAGLTVPISLKENELIYPTTLGVLGDGRSFVDRGQADRIKELCEKGIIREAIDTEDDV